MGPLLRRDFEVGEKIVGQIHPTSHKTNGKALLNERDLNFFDILKPNESKDLNAK